MAKQGQAMPTTVIPSFRAKISDGKSVRVVTDKSTEVSKFYVIQNFLGAAFQSAEVGEDVVLNIEQAEYETNQLTDGEDYEVGTKIYFNESTGNFTTQKTNRYAGIVTQDKDDDGVILFILAPQTLELSEGGEG